MASALRTLMVGPVDLADDALEQKVVEKVDQEREAARQQLQAEWASAADVFSSRLARTYPFDDRDKYADPGDVVELFGPGGTLAGFAEFSAQSPVRAGRATTNALQGAEKIRNNLDMTNDGFQAQFRLQALSVNSTGSARGDENRRKIDTVILTINGEQLKDRLAQTHRDFTWHSKDENLECSLELKSSRSRADIASIGFTGTTWSICQLFDRAQVTETSEGRKVIWPFPEHDIEIEFLLTTREDAEPFFISNSAFRRFSLRPGVHE
jgi:type VI protein secretion system component VasK